MSLVGYEREEVSGQTIWMVKNSWGTSWGENGFGKVIVSENNRYGTAYVEKPYFAPNIDKYKIACIDEDRDNYCNWGISEAKPNACPKSCRPEKDCNDSDPKLGAFASDFRCQPATASPTPTPPRPCPSLCIGRFCPKLPCRVP